MHVILQVLVFLLLLFFCLPFPSLRNCKLAFLLKISQYGDRCSDVSIFQGIFLKSDIIIHNISFFKEILGAANLTGRYIKKAKKTKKTKQRQKKPKQNWINQVDAGHVIKSKAPVKLKALYLYYHASYDQETWQDGD